MFETEVVGNYILRKINILTIHGLTTYLAGEEIFSKKNILVMRGRMTQNAARADVSQGRKLGYFITTPKYKKCIPKDKKYAAFL